MDARPLIWIGSSRKDLKGFPLEVRKTFGFGLWQAQIGGKHLNAKILKGYKGAGVLEITEDFKGSTFRAVYTVRFAGLVFVLHVFQKKSKIRIKTPKSEMDLIRKRLKTAEEYHAQWQEEQKSDSR